MLDRTSADRGLSEEQRMMRQSCRDFVDEVVLPFIKQNWKLEWSMVPEDRLPPRILEEAEKIGIRLCRTGRSRFCCGSLHRSICRKSGSSVWWPTRNS